MSQEFQPMAAQLSKKAALPLAKIFATCRNNVSNTGPWVTTCSLIETEWHIYASVVEAIIGSDNGLSPIWRHAIISTNVGIFVNWNLGTNLIEILIEIQTFSFKKMHLKTSGKWLPFCLGLNVLTHWGQDNIADIFQTIFSNAFHWMKMFEFQIQFDLSLFLRVQLTIIQHWFR